MRLEPARPVEMVETRRRPTPLVSKISHTTRKSPTNLMLVEHEPEPEPEPEPVDEVDALAAFEAQMAGSNLRRPHVPATVDFDYKEEVQEEYDEEYDDDYEDYDDDEDEEYDSEDDLKPPDEDVELPPWKGQFDFLWVGAVLMFGIGDVVSTWWAIQHGAQEANPFLHNIVHGNFMVFILIKIILLGIAFLYSYVILMENGHDARFMPAVFILAGAYLVVNNYMVVQNMIDAGATTGSGFSD